ncbi:DUF4177 domain-containing protein [Yoonia litorea]|uniref:DUF4177 domain-containing protein n=1 Tax=Yoonia litorea TaxID=1123755 RepID=A0A1I6MF20_9RHOB|nr:DUF4177 domain-containing protein [Yoonia litorea]SFS14304.1 protein of unknown function [Yoonia litorea]
MSYEYKVVPAPVRGLKAKGLKTPEDRFAHALETEMNSLAADGWEYLRADTLPCEKRDGLLSKTTSFQNMLVFRRAKKTTVSQQKREPVITAPAPVKAASVSEADEPTQIADEPAKSQKKGDKGSADVAAE